MDSENFFYDTGLQTLEVCPITGHLRTLVRLSPFHNEVREFSHRWYHYQTRRRFVPHTK